MKPSVTTAREGARLGAPGVGGCKWDTLTLGDERYPERLRTIADPPAVLYCDGVPTPVDRYAIALVGARKATPYGLRVTMALAGELAGLGFTIVSGLARGIDAAAHRGALQAGGRTIAVQGCGLDITYPPEHAELRAEIAGAGAVVTEFSPGTAPLAHHFPRRNRIISGLALGVVVVEAAEGSGSLITARLALEQGREVFAVPGPVDGPLSRGPHGLLKQGAKLTETVDDILEELLPQLEGSVMEDAVGAREGQIRSAGRPVKATRIPWEPPNLSPDERMVYALVGGAPMHIDELVEHSRLAPAILAGVLLGLELKTAVRRLPGQRYERTR